MRPKYRIRQASELNKFHASQFYVEYQTRWLHRWLKWRMLGMDGIEGYPFYYDTAQEAEYDFLQRGCGISRDLIVKEAAHE